MIESPHINTTLDKFENVLSIGYGIPPKVAESIKDMSRTFFLGNKELNSFVSGQLKYEAISVNQHVGVARIKCKTQTVVLTLIDPSDHTKKGADKRRHILERITREAFEQNGLLTQEDLAVILNSDVRTIRRDVKHLSGQKVMLPLRGNIKSIGRGQTHKEIIIELALAKYTFSEISRRTHHCINSIERYLENFCKVTHCYLKNMPRNEISYICGNSDGVVEQYISLYEKHKESCKEQIDILLKKYKDFDVSEETKKKMMVMNKWLKK
jgi:hypothetical protein